MLSRHFALVHLSLCGRYHGDSSLGGYCVCARICVGVCVRRGGGKKAVCPNLLLEEAEAVLLTAAMGTVIE